MKDTDKEREALDKVFDELERRSNTHRDNLEDSYNSRAKRYLKHEIAKLIEIKEKEAWWQGMAFYHDNQNSDRVATEFARATRFYAGVSKSEADRAKRILDQLKGENTKPVKE